MPKVWTAADLVDEPDMHPQPAFPLSGTPEDLSAEQEEVGSCDSACYALASIYGLLLPVQVLADFLSKVPREQLESMKFPTEPDRFFGCGGSPSRAAMYPCIYGTPLQMPSLARAEV